MLFPNSVSSYVYAPNFCINLVTFSKKGEDVMKRFFKRMIARREAIVKEVLEILDRLLPNEEYVLKDKEPKKKGKIRAQSSAQESQHPLSKKEVNEHAT